VPFDVAHTRLRDGRPVVVRPLVPGDQRLVREVFDRLGPDSRLRRFLAVTPELPEPRLRSISGVDDERVEGLLAVDAGDGRALGWATLARLPGDERAAEVSVAVADDVQRLGVGTLLLEEVARRAPALGVEVLAGTVAGENRRARRLLERLGDARSATSGGVVELRVRLPAEQRGLPEALHDVLRGAARGALRQVLHLPAARRLARWGLPALGRLPLP